MNRKVFISFLGYSNYGACHYCKDNYKSEKVRFVQEATLDFLHKEGEWTSNDVAYILLTKGAEAVNWVDNGQKDFNTKEPIIQPGLRTCLENLNLPVKIVPVHGLPDGNNPEEILEIFQRVFDLLLDGDDLYFDLTHGFRYLPMLSLVLGNYAKFLKKTKVRSITYGNYEGRNKVTEEALLVDLLPLSAVQDWTNAAADYLNNGYVTSLLKLSTEYLTPFLREARGRNAGLNAMNSYVKLLGTIVDEFITCRGKSIIQSGNIKKIKDKIKEIDYSSLIQPLQPVIEKINASLDRFDSNENVKNGFVAARWCFDNNLYQQSVTTLLETLVSYICCKNNLDFQNKDQRRLVNMAFSIHFNDTPEEKWELNNNQSAEVLEQQKQVIRQLIHTQEISNLSDTFARCTEYRNDYNHFGIRSNAQNSLALKESIRKALEEVESYFSQQNDFPVCASENRRILVNLSNHPYKQWGSLQKEMALEYGELVDYPFPMVDPQLSEIEINELAERINSEIVSLYGQTDLTIHIMGEFTLSNRLIAKFKEQGIPCIASCAARNVTEEKDIKTVVFEFVRFREYI